MTDGMENISSVCRGFAGGKTKQKRHKAWLPVIPSCMQHPSKDKGTSKGWIRAPILGSVPWHQLCSSERTRDAPEKSPLGGSFEGDLSCQALSLQQPTGWHLFPNSTPPYFTVIKQNLTSSPNKTLLGGEMGRFDPHHVSFCSREGTELSPSGCLLLPLALRQFSAEVGGSDAEDPLVSSESFVSNCYFLIFFLAMPFSVVYFYCTSSCKTGAGASQASLCV